MTDFSIEAIPFNSGAISVWADADARRRNWPVVYSISNDSEIYVGETLNAASRLNQHLSSSERQRLKRVRILLDETFNKSVCLDLESHLIRYLHGDGKYSVLNRNSGITDSNYFNRGEYRKKFEEIYEALMQEGLFTKTIPEIVNSNLFKYSPFKALSIDQQIAVDEIVKKYLSDSGAQSESIVVKGDPGTGKTIVAIYLIKLLMDIAKSEPDDVMGEDTAFSHYFTEQYRKQLKELRVALVIPQQSLRNTIQTVFKKTPGLNKEMVLNAFEVGASGEKFDLLIVDEAHRLQRRSNQPSAALNTKFREINIKLFGEDRDSITQLDWIKKQSDSQIFLIDSDQRIKPADLPTKDLKSLVSEASAHRRIFHLSSQMRVAAGADYIDYVGRLLAGEQMPPVDFSPYEFKFFDDISQMKQAILKKNEQHGLARLIAGYAWEWKSKKNSQQPDIEIGNEKLFWNRTATDWINSETSIDEVGSIHTVQGYDLNYAGVIIGKDLGYDPQTKKIVFNREHYFDKKGRENNPRLGLEFSDEDLLEYVCNIYRVLMTRGIRGTHVYVCDEGLRSLIQSRNWAENASTLLD